MASTFGLLSESEECLDVLFVSWESQDLVLLEIQVEQGLGPPLVT